MPATVKLDFLDQSQSRQCDLYQMLPNKVVDSIQLNPTCVADFHFFSLEGLSCGAMIWTQTKQKMTLFKFQIYQPGLID